MDYAQLLHDIEIWAEAHGVRVRSSPLQPEQAGAFNGVSVTLNSRYAAEELAYYLAHALGSIVRWSLSGDVVQGMFDELRAAKADKSDAARLERAIQAYRALEIESSEFAVWLLAQLGHGAAVPSYTNFMRADLEALTAFHRTGQAPVWRDFFSQWNVEVAAGRQEVPPFHPKPIPSFTPVAIQRQEVLQKQR